MIVPPACGRRNSDMPCRPMNVASVTTIAGMFSQVISQPDPNRTVDFRVEMGKDYANCLYALPPEFIVPAPAGH